MFINRHIRTLALGVYVSCFLVSLLGLGDFARDETEYHFPNLMNFYQHGLGATFNSTYSAANTPLPYIMCLWVAKFSSPSLFTARVTTAVISFLAFLIVLRLVELSGCPKYYSLTFLFFPYFFANSFVFYVINYGLFFALLAFLMFRKTEGKTNYALDLLVGAIVALAVLCQQFYLMIPPAIIISRMWFSLKHEGGQFFFPSWKRLLSSLILILPLLLPLIVFVQWGGLTHPNFRRHSLMFQPSTVTGILFVTGFYFFPFVLQSYAKLSKTKLLFTLLISIIVVLLFRPLFSDNQGPGIFTGLTHHLIVSSGVVHPLLPIVLMTGLVCSGMLVLTELFGDLSTSWEFALFVCCIFLSVAYMFNAQIGERHLLGVISMLFLLVLPRMQRVTVKYYLTAMSCLGISYFIYTTFIKYGSG